MKEGWKEEDTGTCFSGVSRLLQAPTRANSSSGTEQADIIVPWVSTMLRCVSG